jgi:hypothetical protein
MYLVSVAAAGTTVNHGLDVLEGALALMDPNITIIVHHP